MTMLTVPLFPLNTILYPDGYLPLQIFEVRYLNMIRECVETNTPFGVICLLDGDEVRKPEDTIRLASVGTLARLENVETLSPSLLKVQTVGTERFELQSASQAKGGLWMGGVTTIAQDPVIDVPEYLRNCSEQLQQVAQALQSEDLPKERHPFQPPYRFNDCGWVANRWCELLPMDPAMKLQLLALDNPLVRLELINDTLEQHSLG